MSVQGLDALSYRSRLVGKVARHFRVLSTVASAALLLLFVLASSALYYRSLDDPHLIPGIFIEQLQLGAASPAQLKTSMEQEVRRFLRAPLSLHYGDQQRWISRRELGVEVDTSITIQRVQRIGKTGHFLQDLVDRIQARRGTLRIPLAARLNHNVALQYFIQLKEEIDRLPTQPRLDLDHAVVLPGHEGYQLHVYDSLARTELAISRRLDAVKIAVTVRQPKDKAKFKNLVINHVLGQFSTVYSLADKDADRGHNLKVGASKLDGMVIPPQGTLSFNETVGPRTEDHGYRTAPVIFEGELVDGMAGGACQLSSTLFAASFFAGLELENSRPHTRPSSYIKMGLDAAVAYPTTDLVLKNIYPFPVAIHFKVNAGKVTVRILGQKRPWKRIVFEREVKETIPFTTVVRQDDTIPRGNKVTAQMGVPGFRLERRRLFYGSTKEPARVEKRDLYYPPTTEYIKEGTGPANPEWKQPPLRRPFGEVPPEFRLEN